MLFFVIPSGVQGRLEGLIWLETASKWRGSDSFFFLAWSSSITSAWSFPALWCDPHHVVGLPKHLPHTSSLVPSSSRVTCRSDTKFLTNNIVNSESLKKCKLYSQKEKSITTVLRKFIESSLTSPTTWSTKHSITLKQTYNEIYKAAYDSSTSQTPHVLLFGECCWTKKTDGLLDSKTAYHQPPISLLMRPVSYSPTTPGGHYSSYDIDRWLARVWPRRYHNYSLDFHTQCI